ncbi:hypothetical protein L198_00486 [Cryptococcus wingfieldii CBS 7118]|uniref:Uncharacterized protein n=1 Tax=Cryptococcus wingfieldii CBS 7118 TaxID=1295528 RepID=A0A1E3K7B6_9TREE|nr:hypothetical protein L198_00486 [Cryptococcus wingfieldii CBS 7118]ODO08753.1 hypothetical protein L198_00486 [Cryptococcus wingfieldii CBS 7118]
MPRTDKQSSKSRHSGERGQEQYDNAPDHHSFAKSRMTPVASATTTPGSKTPKASTRRSSEGSRYLTAIASNLPGAMASLSLTPASTSADQSAKFSLPPPEELPWDWRHQTGMSLAMDEHDGDGASVRSLSSFSGGYTSGEEGRAFFVATEEQGKGGRNKAKKVVARRAERDWTLLSNEGQDAGDYHARFQAEEGKEEPEYSRDDDLESSAIFSRRTKDENWQNGFARSGRREYTNPDSSGSKR